MGNKQSKRKQARPDNSISPGSGALSEARARIKAAKDAEAQKIPAGPSTSNDGEKKDELGAEKKVYSWDVAKAKLDPKDYIFSKRKGETLIREPGKIQGQQFIIEECEDCDIFLCDYSATVSVDLCKNCRIFIGPVESSVFLRDCSNCKFVIACQQFRTRSCTDCDLLLFSQTQPVVETSRRLAFGCFQYFYPKLKEQFDAAGMSVFNNKWSLIYDFSNRSDSYSFLSTLTTAKDLLKPLPPSVSMVSGFDNTTPDIEVVPITWGSRPRPGSSESCLVIVLPKHSSLAFTIIGKAREEGLTLIQTAHITLDEATAKQLLAKGTTAKTFLPLISHGPVTGLEFAGSTCWQILKQVTQDITRAQGQGTSPAFYLADDTQSSASQVPIFFQVKNEAKPVH